MNTSTSVLDILAEDLPVMDLTVSRERNALVVRRNEHFSTRIEIAPHQEGDSPIGPIKSVVQIRTDLPDEMARMIVGKRKMDRLAVMNRVASLGALTFDGQRVFVGSRLTIFESENAWNIHEPLILMSIIGAADAILRGTEAALNGEKIDSDESAWQASDFEQVEEMMSGRCVCSISETGFTAEFGLRPGATTACAGDWNSTALWSIRANEPHPVVGGGLFCLLQLPHRVSDESRLTEVLAQLNRLEMHPHALPPHFGAWCEGKVGGNPAYVSFLPNVLHRLAPGIAANMTVWASARAQWANITLASMGISAERAKAEGRGSRLFGFLRR
jgi:hypothetical protein